MTLTDEQLLRPARIYPLSSDNRAPDTQRPHVKTKLNRSFRPPYLPSIMSASLIVYYMFCQMPNRIFAAMTRFVKTQYHLTTA
jgi:hypothetical protein